MKEISLKAYAKINLDLKVLGKLPDGYHRISSTFQAISLHDSLRITRIKKGFQLTGSLVCNNEDNLITKAKNSLENTVGHSLPCSIDLQKSIPISAGLGGGSSDAAAALHGLNRIFDIGLSLDELISMGIKIGSDVPFFLNNSGTALVGGIGEKIISGKMPLARFYVVARPHKRISTREIYKKHDETAMGFFDIVKEICPDSGRVHEYLSSLSRECGMSGTGPSIFAGFKNYRDALNASKGLEAFNGDIFICRPMRFTYEAAGW